MYLVTGITNDPKQLLELNLPDGTTTQLSITFSPMQFGWFITELTYQDRIIRNFRITNNPNMLLQFQNLISFGLGCFSQNNREPSQQEDFSSQASRLYILDATEVQEYYEVLQSG